MTFLTILLLNKVFLLISIFVTTAVTGLLFLISATSHPIFAQDGLTAKEALEKTFGKGNGNGNGETSFTIEDLNPEEDLAQDLANKTFTKGMSEEVKSVVKKLREQSPEYKAKQALTYKYTELQEKYYLECIVNKESGEFKNTMDCLTWSQDNAQIQLGLKSK